MQTNSEEETLPKTAYRALQTVLLVFAAGMLALHYLHLSADFPNYSPWMDWSKYTDEGWYGDAAIRHFQLGHWYVPGAFNPAAALPVWPLLEAVVFRFTGVSLVAARALSVSVFGGTLAASWFLVRRSVLRTAAVGSHRHRAGLAATAAVLLLVVSPFCYAFTRLAILEPLLMLLMLLALLAAGSLRPIRAGARSELRANLLPIIALGVLLPAMVLTKTTAVFLVPAIAWMILATLQYRFVSTLRIGVAIALLAAALWMAYYFGIVVPEYLEDYRYLFSANAYTFVTWDTLAPAVQEMLKAGLWIGKPLYLTACFCVIIALASLRRLRAHPLLPALLLWIAGFATFLVYHNNLQPRYYYVLAVPLTLMVPVVLSELVLVRLNTRAGLRMASVALALLLLMIMVPATAQTLHYVRHPEFTLVHAADHIRDYIDAAERRDPAHSRLLLSISGSEFSLMTGLPSICDDFGTLDLEEEVKVYRPGWYVAWNQVEDDKMDALTPQYHLERVATFPAMDDPERNLLILYRLDPPSPTLQKKHRRKLTPRQLRTKMGQQPSTEQLKH